jgi:hypothetical protein
LEAFADVVDLTRLDVERQLWMILYYARAVVFAEGGGRFLDLGERGREKVGRMLQKIPEVRRSWPSVTHVLRFALWHPLIFRFTKRKRERRLVRTRDGTMLRKLGATAAERRRIEETVNPTKEPGPREAEREARRETLRELHAQNGSKLSAREAQQLLTEAGYKASYETVRKDLVAICPKRRKR